MRKLWVICLSLLLSMSIIGNCYADSVMIDPGHGGNDSGAISYDNTLLEKDLNLDTSKAIIDELNKYGITTYTTRTKDEYVSLRKRSEMANAIEDLDLFVSVHHNACTNPTVNRSEVIYSVKEQESQKLAECIASKLKGMNNVEVIIYNRYNAKGSDYYSVLRHTKATSVIVEISFLTSKEGVELVDTHEERVKNGILVAQGIMDYLGTDYTNTKPVDKEVGKIKKVKTKTGIDLISDIINTKNKKTTSKWLDLLRRM